MIGLLRGTVAASSLGRVTLDVGGVGYEVLVPPAATLGGVGATLTLHTHLVVREDALTLYGFPDPAGKAVFATLLSVTGVGPKLALAALGALGAEGLRRAVITEDVAALTVVPGVGRKSAQRMVLELREKLGGSGDGVPGSEGTAGGALTPREEVREALAALGYGPAEVARTVEALPGDTDEAPEELLRRALRALGRQPA